MIRPVALETRIAPQYRDALVVFGLALGLRLVFSALLADTFDKDEFVYLALGQDVGHGSMPYRDFGFFHPPGFLVLLGLLNPVTALWWPLARLADVLLDSVTAVLVWSVGQRLYGQRGGLAAGILYAVNPVVLISAVRVDQEVTVTALGMTAITLVVLNRSRAGAILAGACVGVAFWIKYPIVLFLPVTLLVASRRAWLCLLGFVVATGVLFFPYLGEFHTMYHETVLWQTVDRYRTPLDLRIETVAIFWLAINPFAVVALLRPSRPLWPAIGFTFGGFFVITASVYSHYFMLIAPFAALLGAPLAARLVRVPPIALATGCLIVTVVVAGMVRSWGNDFGLVIANHFSDIRPVVQFIDRTTPPGTPILASRIQYPYLAGRPWIAHYFWDESTIVSAQQLEHSLSRKSMVVLDPWTDWFLFPTTLTNYLDGRCKRIRLSDSTIWIMSQCSSI